MDKAITTAELFRLLSLSIGKEKEATPYMVGKVMGVSPGTATGWMRSYQVMDDANAEKAAAMLGLDLDYVVLSLQAERAIKSNMDKIAAIFERAAVASLTHAAALVFSVFLLIFASVPATAHAGDRILNNASESTLCVQFARRFWRRLVTWFSPPGPVPAL